MRETTQLAMSRYSGEGDMLRGVLSFSKGFSEVRLPTTAVHKP